MGTGFVMPSELDRHEKTFTAWPDRETLRHPEDHEKVLQGYADVINAVSEFEPVTVLVNQEDEDTAKKLCTAQADFAVLAHADGSVRDTGPSFVKHPEKGLAGVCWRYNGRGERFQNFLRDEDAAPDLLDMLNIPAVYSDFIMEGGAFNSDGAGNLITTEKCVLNPNRNKFSIKSETENELKEKLGVSAVIWLETGILGDEADGHVENVACFAGPGQILLQVCTDMNDIQYNFSLSNNNTLRREKTADGGKPEVISVVQPPKRKYGEKRLPLSYISFCPVNGGLIVPVFGGDASAADDAALGVFREIFPDRKILTVDGMKLVTECRNVHSITLQMPQL